jgi:UDP-2,4-diacetamido-2,4,6-trideoxy-beta-L-altropyranose hydrolase
MARIVFRCDGGTALGGGHVMRCLVLAHNFADRGWDVGFAASAETFASVVALDQSAVERAVLPSQAEAEPAVIAERWSDGTDVLVVDHYQRDAAFERTLRPWARRIVVIDDLADRAHDADVLVDAAAKDEGAYRELTPAGCRILVGPAFAIVHRAFREARAKALARRDGRRVRRVFVGFGQIDAPNATMSALTALDAAGFTGQVDVVLGRGAPHLRQVQAQTHDRVRVYVDSHDVAALMTDADLAIGGGGVTAWERCCLGLPSVLIGIAGNQSSTTARIVSVGAGIDAGRVGPDTEGRIAEALRRLLDDDPHRPAMARAAAALVDGEGAERIVQAVIA